MAVHTGILGKVVHSWYFRDTFRAFSNVSIGSGQGGANLRRKWTRNREIGYVGIGPEIPGERRNR